MRDTKVERAQHEATGKHQGSLKRFLRDLHRGQEREEREKERAKAEVARLNGVVLSQAPPAGSDQNAAAGAPWRRKAANAPQPPPPPPAPVSAEERKRQLAQLVELGVAIPQEYRGELALAGEWETVSETVIPAVAKDEEEEEDEKKGKAGITLVRGVKRKPHSRGDDGEDEEEEAGKRRAWGSAVKTYPNPDASDAGLDALLASTATSPQSNMAKQKADVKGKAEDGAQPGEAEEAAGNVPQPDLGARPGSPPLKRELSEEEQVGLSVSADAAPPPEIKTEEGMGGDSGAVFFKKRKPKAMRRAAAEG